MQFHERLQELMRKEGLSKYRLGRELGVSDTVVGRWANGLALPRGDNLDKLSEFFHVSADYLLGKSDSTLVELPHEELREVISSDGIHILLDETPNHLTDEDWEEVMDFIRFKQRRYGH